MNPLSPGNLARKGRGGETAEDFVAGADFSRWFLAFFFLGVAIFYTVRIVVARRKSGVSPVYLGEPGTVHWATHAVFRVFRVLILGVCIVRLLWPEFDSYLVTFDLLWHSTVLLLGSGLLLASFFAIIAIHVSMGEDWRSGTRAVDSTRLITTGPFKLSRNPMMLCVMTGQVGLFLALPSLFTLICLVVGVWAVVAQVSVEEGALQQRFGAEYESYAAQTPRWLIFR